ncbi:MAG: choline ABC transporter permease subunit [Dongiaceae bacterium]
MGQIETWISDNKIPIGDWAKNLVDWLLLHVGWLFDFITTILKVPIEGTVALFLVVHPLIFIAITAAIVFVIQRNWWLVFGTVIGMLFILNQGLWDPMIETLVLILYATLVCLAVGIPIGIAAARRPWIYRSIAPLLDMMQTIPTFVYLVPMLFLFGLGAVPGIIATVIFAIPAPIRLTYLGISQVPTALVEAGESFGATRWQLLNRVKLPAAMPTIMAGVNQCIMLCLSMVVIAGMVGAGGLGNAVVRALGQAKMQLGVEAGLAIVIVAIVLDRTLKQRVRKSS